MTELAKCNSSSSTSSELASKLCCVCGDKALGYNFNAITCESCKAFFRRNALKTKDFKCPFNDGCKVDVVTRRFCQRCRLKKCFEIGMKKEWIMTEEEKKIKKQKIEENRQKRSNQPDVLPAGLLTPKSDCCESTVFSPSSSSTSSCDMSPVVRTTATTVFALTPSPSPDSPVGGRLHELTADERSSLDELIVANGAMKSPIPDVDGRLHDDPSLINVINLTDIAIRRLIKMSKKIGAFRSLCQECQIALLKGGCTELMILRSVMTYNPENDCWHGPSVMRIKLDVLREAKGNLYDEHKRFIQSFAVEWRVDDNIMLLLGAITLFVPERSNVLHADVIGRRQQSYFALLRRYLESVYAADEARATYLTLMQRIDELHVLNENHVRVFLDVNPKDVEPLLIEIFDLKNQ